MTNPISKLKNVEYTRRYSAEKDACVHIISSTKWGRDLELLLEEEWKNIKRYDDSVAATRELQNQTPALVLVEPTAHGLETFRWVELGIQVKSRTLLIAPENVSQLDWMRLMRKAAAVDIGGILLSQESKAAASELNSVLIDAVSLKLSQSKEIEFVTTAAGGYSLAATVKREEVVRELFSLLADEFTLSSNHLAAGFVLLDTYDLWKRPKDTQSELHFNYRRIERQIEGSDTEKLLNVSLQVKLAFELGDFSEPKFESILREANFGPLARRKLLKKYSEVHLLVTMGTQHNNVLKIA